MKQRNQNTIIKKAKQTDPNKEGHLTDRSSCRSLLEGLYHGTDKIKTRVMLTMLIITMITRKPAVGTRQR